MVLKLDQCSYPNNDKECKNTDVFIIHIPQVVVGEFAKSPLVFFFIFHSSNENAQITSYIPQVVVGKFSDDSIVLFLICHNLNQ